jgi:hypothetical protein
MCVYLLVRTFLVCMHKLKQLITKCEISKNKYLKIYFWLQLYNLVIVTFAHLDYYFYYDDLILEKKQITKL